MTFATLPSPPPSPADAGAARGAPSEADRWIHISAAAAPLVGAVLRCLPRRDME